MLRGNHLEREESEYGSLSRRSNSPNFNVHENNEGIHYPNPMESRSSKSAEYGHSSAALFLLLNLLGYQGNLT